MLMAPLTCHIFESTREFLKARWDKAEKEARPYHQEDEKLYEAHNFVLKGLACLIQDNRAAEEYFANHFAARRHPTTSSVQRLSQDNMVENNRPSNYGAVHTDTELSWPWAQESGFAWPCGDDDRAETEIKSWINMIIIQASYLPRAATLLNTLLSNNEHLLDEFVDTTILETFIENIRGNSVVRLHESRFRVLLLLPSHMQTKAPRRRLWRSSVRSALVKGTKFCRIKSSA